MKSERRKRTGVMEAKPLNMEKHLPRLEACFFQPKLNGYRCLAIPNVETGEYDLVGSTGLPILTMPHITEQLPALLGVPRADADYTTPTLDGELYCHGMPFQEISHRIRGGVDVAPEERLAIHFWVFDLINRESQDLRFVRLQSYKYQHTGYIHRLETIRRVNPNKLTLDFYRNTFIWRGFEGLIIRQELAPYTPGKTDYLLKYKEPRVLRATVIGVTEKITKDGIQSDSLGAFLCESEGVRFKVGSGFTLAEREHWWVNPCEGMAIAVEYYDRSEAGVPIHPVYKGLWSDYSHG